MEGEDPEEHQNVIYGDLLRQANEKIGERVRQKSDLSLIQMQVEKYLDPQIRNRMDAFKKQLMSQNRLMQQNYQYGLANRDMLHLAQ